MYEISDLEAAELIVGVIRSHLEENPHTGLDVIDILLYDPEEREDRTIVTSRIRVFEQVMSRATAAV